MFGLLAWTGIWKPPADEEKLNHVCVCLRFELSDHVDSIDSSLENLQNILNTQTFTFDASPLIEVGVTEMH